MCGVSVDWRWGRCLSVSGGIGGDREPLFIIVGALFVCGIFVGFVYSGGAKLLRGFRGKFLLILSKAFSWSVCNT